MLEKVKLQIVLFVIQIYNMITKHNIWNYKDMVGDHIIPWSKGGKTERGNLQMLYKHHNSLKSNY